MLHNLFKFNAATGAQPDVWEVRAFCGGDPTMGLLPPAQIPPGEQCPGCAAVTERVVAAEVELDRAFAMVKHLLLLSFVHAGVPEDRGYALQGGEGRAVVTLELKAVAQPGCGTVGPRGHVCFEHVGGMHHGVICEAAPDRDPVGSSGAWPRSDEAAIGAQAANAARKD